MDFSTLSLVSVTTEASWEYILFFVLSEIVDLGLFTDEIAHADEAGGEGLLLYVLGLLLNVRFGNRLKLTNFSFEHPIVALEMSLY